MTQYHISVIVIYDVMLYIEKTKKRKERNKRRKRRKSKLNYKEIKERKHYQVILL